MKDEQQYQDEEFVEELQADDPAPDDSPYNDWERYPWGWPGNNGPMVL